MREGNGTPSSAPQRRYAERAACLRLAGVIQPFRGSGESLDRNDVHITETRDGQQLIPRPPLSLIVWVRSIIPLVVLTAPEVSLHCT
jgi:hypothetical protein